MDAAGKDSAIEHVMSGVNPQGVQVVSFKQPSAEELDHNYLWRIAKALPERGRIGIFNRSHYEEVVALRVHPEWLDAQRLPPGPPRRGVLARALRGHQRVRAAPCPQRHEDRQVLPPRLQGGAEAALLRAARHARQGVEVQRRRRRRARALGRLHGRLRGRDLGDLDGVGAVVRRPRRRQEGDAGDRGGRDRGDARTASTCAGRRCLRGSTRRTWRPASGSRPKRDGD